MGKYIAFLRGVNVGGIVLKMEDFKKVLEYLGYRNVRTYIQSGNAVFENSESNKKRMEAEIAFEIKIIGKITTVAIVLAMDELKGIVESHPLAGSGDADNLYVTLLADHPQKEDVEVLMETMNDIDIHSVKNKVVYSYYGNGYGTSKRSNNFIEKILKVSATTRNWNTMRKIMELCAESGKQPRDAISSHNGEKK